MNVGQPHSGWIWFFTASLWFGLVLPWFTDFCLCILSDCYISNEGERYVERSRLHHQLPLCGDHWASAEGLLWRENMKYSLVLSFEVLKYSEGVLWCEKRKNTIRDGGSTGSTGLYATCTVVTVDRDLHCLPLHYVWTHYSTLTAWVIRSWKYST